MHLAKLTPILPVERQNLIRVSLDTRATVDTTVALQGLGIFNNFRVSRDPQNRCQAGDPSHKPARQELSPQARFWTVLLTVLCSVIS